LIQDVREVWAEVWIKEVRKKKVWKVSEIAFLLKVHPNTVFCWIREGKLKAVNVSNGKLPRYRVHQDDLIEFLKERHSYVVDF